MGPLELAELLEAQGPSGEVQFLDVREPHEHETAALPHFALKPLSRCALALVGPLRAQSRAGPVGLSSGVQETAFLNEVNPSSEHRCSSSCDQVKMALQDVATL